MQKLWKLRTHIKLLFSSFGAKTVYMETQFCLSHFTTELKKVKTIEIEIYSDLEGHTFN